METIVIVSVLSTLGVVALVMALVVAFIKLRKKVDVNNHKDDVALVHQKIDKLRNDIEKSTALDEVYRDMEDKFKETLQRINVNNEDIWREVESVRRFIDSRCDKLDSKITAVPNTKQILTD